MDSNKITELSNIINSLTSSIFANQAVSTSDKESLTRLRSDFEGIIREYQQRIDSVTSSFISRLQSKTDEIRRRVDDINNKISG